MSWVTHQHEASYPLHGQAERFFRSLCSVFLLSIAYLALSSHLEFSWQFSWRATQRLEQCSDGFYLMSEFIALKRCPAQNNRAWVEFSQKSCAFEQDSLSLWFLISKTTSSWPWRFSSYGDPVQKHVRDGSNSDVFLQPSGSEPLSELPSVLFHGNLRLFFPDFTQNASSLYTWPSF